MVNEQNERGAIQLTASVNAVQSAPDDQRVQPMDRGVARSDADQVDSHSGMTVWKRRRHKATIHTRDSNKINSGTRTWVRAKRSIHGRVVGPLLAISPCSR